MKELCVKELCVGESCVCERVVCERIVYDKTFGQRPIVKFLVGLCKFPEGLRILDCEICQSDFETCNSDCETIK